MFWDWMDYWEIEVVGYLVSLFLVDLINLLSLH